jgi:hypothetical protein
MDFLDSVAGKMDAMKQLQFSRALGSKTVVQESRKFLGMLKMTWFLHGIWNIDAF